VRVRPGPIASVAGALLAVVVACAPAGPLAAEPSPTVSGTSRPPSPGVVVAASPSVARAIPDGYRIRIPRLRIDLPIAEGIIQRDVDQQQTPEGYAFHLPGAAIPGEAGNTYLYSHARAGMFLALWDARVGDEVLILAPDGRTLRYSVSEVRPRVAPNDISVAQPTADERLTLQTSTGPSPSDPRFVVIALPRQ
jgi:LPXTG-site transpeptidase (sortase) family protein